MGKGAFHGPDSSEFIGSDRKLHDAREVSASLGMAPSEIAPGDQVDPVAFALCPEHGAVKAWLAELDQEEAELQRQMLEGANPGVTQDKLGTVRLARREAAAFDREFTEHYALGSLDCLIEMIEEVREHDILTHLPAHEQATARIALDRAVTAYRQDFWPEPAGK